MGFIFYVVFLGQLLVKYPFHLQVGSVSVRRRLSLFVLFLYRSQKVCVHVGEARASNGIQPIKMLDFEQWTNRTMNAR